jgi:hypothetical protein
MNAWATRMGGTWLMGECEINDVRIIHNGVDIDDDDGDGGSQKQTVQILPNQGLLVKRCRFLEESGCASICVNCCKIPTQNFFLHDMGLPLTMTPNYETYECQFDFGRLPTQEDELAARQTPCLDRCPTSGGLRKFHTTNRRTTTSETTATSTTSTCSLMDD